LALRLVKSIKKKKRRDSFSIIADMLMHVQQSPFKKTRLMMLLNLNPAIFEKYMSYSLRAGLITYDGQFRITPKGDTFLRKLHHYLQMREKLTRLEDQLIKDLRSWGEWT
jgi:predicted transcriptional regulator